MIKLGVYGDSFVDWATPHKYYVREQKDLALKTWAYRLQDHYSVDYYALNGSSLYWGLTQFEQTHSQYDRVLFVITHAGRYPVPLQLASTGDRLWGLAGMLHIDFLLSGKKFSLTDQEKNKLQSIRDYAIWARDDEHNRYVHNLMIDRIKTLRPDSLIVPIETGIMPGLTGLYDYAFSSFRSWDPDFFQGLARPMWKVRDYDDLRAVCHMTQPAHELALKDILNALDTGRWAPDIPSVIPHPEPLDYYYKLKT